VEEVTKNIHDAIVLYVAALVEFGEDVPPPSSQGARVDVRP
jgi:predicted RNase H-like HicB family nuclease